MCWLTRPKTSRRTIEREISVVKIKSGLCDASAAAIDCLLLSYQLIISLDIAKDEIEEVEMVISRSVGLQTRSSRIICVSFSLGPVSPQSLRSSPSLALRT